MKKNFRKLFLAGVTLFLMVAFMPIAKAYTVDFEVMPYNDEAEVSGTIVGASKIEPVVDGGAFDVSFSPKANYEWSTAGNGNISCFVGDSPNQLDLKDSTYNYDKTTNTLKFTSFKGGTDLTATYKCLVTFSPCKTPTTGDVSIYIIAGMAILGLGAFVVFNKRKSYNN